MLDVEGYDYNGLTFAIPGALLGNPGRKRTKGTANALELRDHGLAGGEIQLQLSETNRVPNDPGFYYAAKCFMYEKETDQGHIGKMVLRRLTEQHGLVSETSVELDELDNSHLVDRLISEVLHWHAKACGPGPLAPPAKKPRKRR